MTTEKIRENRLRDTAKRRGLNLAKSRRRDPQALGYGRWWLEREDGTVALGGSRREGATLDEVEQYLNGGHSHGDPNPYDPSCALCRRKREKEKTT